MNYSISIGNLSIESPEDKEMSAGSAAICFCDAMPDIILNENIYELFPVQKKLTHMVSYLSPPVKLKQIIG